MKICKTFSAPVVKGVYLNETQASKDKEEIKKMSSMCSSNFSRLMHVMTSTRPDICYVVGFLSLYQANPGKEYRQVIKRIFRHL